MAAFFLSQLLSPKGILIAIGVLIFGYLSYSAITFEKNYVALEKANVVLQQNLVTAQNALNQEKKTEKTQQQIAQTTLDSVRTVDTQQLQQTTILQNDNTALQLIRTPTNDQNTQCINSPYVSTILERLRDRTTPTAVSGSTDTGNALTTSGVNNTPASSTNSSK